MKETAVKFELRKNKNKIRLCFWKQVRKNEPRDETKKNKIRPESKLYPSVFLGLDWDYLWTFME